MEQVSQFIQAFIALEFDVTVQLRTESDAVLIEKKLNTLNSMFHGLPSGLHLSTVRTLEKLDDVLVQVQPRVLFEIKQYKHELLGPLYRVYLSSHFHGDNTCFCNFYVAAIEQTLKIIARYNVCNECNGTGLHGGVSCDECVGIGWNLRGGTAFESIGDVITSKVFAVPVERLRL